MAEQDKEQKTEDATPRRLEEARENGQVAMSTEFIAALMLSTAAVCLMLGGGQLARATGDLAGNALAGLDNLGRVELDPAGAAELIEESTVGVLVPLGVIFLPVLLIGLLVGYGQVGFRLTPKAVAPNPSKLNPIKGFQKLFSARAAVRPVMAAAKMLAITAVLGGIVYAHLPEIAQVGDNELGPLLVALGRVSVKAVAGALAVIIVLAVVDLAFQRYQHKKELRMTKQEVKEEHRIAEGDPKVKAKVRQIQRDMALQRMMADVPKATVVVTNPTHYAVALHYEREADVEFAAPRCVAKGKGHVARRIKELAREAGVVLYEDVPLARALHAQVDVGQEIPTELYAAVAEVLGYVYRLEGRVGTQREEAAVH